MIAHKIELLRDQDKTMAKMEPSPMPPLTANSDVSASATPVSANRKELTRQKINNNKYLMALI